MSGRDGRLDGSRGHFLTFRRHLHQYGRELALQLSLINRRLDRYAGAHYPSLILRERDPGTWRRGPENTAKFLRIGIQGWSGGIFCRH